MKNENILVVKREKLFPETAFQGLVASGTQALLEIINREKEFKPRPLMEEDSAYKQIIPYLLFKYQDRYFLMQRKSTNTDQRLKNKYSLGIGGHMRQEDLGNGDSIFDWGKREFHEEIAYSGNLKMSTLGILNDDSNPVGHVHLGLVLLLEGDSEHIKIRSELKSGQLLTALEIQKFYADLETWSQIIFDAILNPLKTEKANQKQSSSVY
jgi:predicted NUDIX family phosphoesterase